MKIFVAGDYCFDYFRFTRATRLCPEAPVPVLVRTETDSVRAGMAGLVVEQLRALVGPENVEYYYGSESIKERTFADGHLIARVDSDSIWTENRFEPIMYNRLRRKRFELMILSDYGKGCFTELEAKYWIEWCQTRGIRSLVDAKKNWQWYQGADFAFPNSHEYVSHDFVSGGTFKHVIQKLGPLGCEVDGVRVPPSAGHECRDTTGAGDIFMAAFAAKLTKTSDLTECAKFANFVAGKSVEHVGTSIIRDVRL